jgi:alpha-1,2-mannosyltransferase
VPEDFEQPWPQPYPDWSVKTTKPITYRPFRYGPKYNVTMGTRSLQWEDWIELDNEWLSYHQQKQARIAERSDRLIMVHDMAKDAAQETLELLSKYLTKRYPSLFRYTSEKEEAIEILETGEVYPIINSDDPMKYAALLVYITFAEERYVLLVSGELKISLECLLRRFTPVEMVCCLQIELMQSTSV